MGNAARLLLRLRIRFPDPLPQSLQRAGAGLRAQPVIGAESLHDGLNHFFLNSIGAGIPLTDDTALRLAAGQIADLYMLLGNEAYADAQDPTIGFGTEPNSQNAEEQRVVEILQ